MFYKFEERKQRPPPQRPLPAPYEGDGSGPKGNRSYDGLRKFSKELSDRMRGIDPKTAEKYRQRGGE